MLFRSAARYQQLSLNPQKLAGQCGKLKCCLNFELDQYKEAVAQFPPPSTKLMTRKGKAGHFKTDIFGGKMWFQYFDEPGASPVPIELEDVREIMAMNERGEKPDDLTGYAVQAEAAPEDALFGDVVGQDDLNRFDSPSGRRRKGRKGGSRRRGQNSGRKGGDAPAAQNGEGGGNSGRRRKKRRLAASSDHVLALTTTDTHGILAVGSNPKLDFSFKTSMLQKRF